MVPLYVIALVSSEPVAVTLMVLSPLSWSVMVTPACAEFASVASRATASNKCFIICNIMLEICF